MFLQSVMHKCFKIMPKKRIEYIDALRGLCIFWVVWYHSSHPIWVEYPFRMPTLFFVSGIFYKHYPWNVFWRKKVNQYVVPFAFFYLLYYVFLLSINYCKYHYLTPEICMSFFDFARLYSGYDGYVVNYPLWFMVALLVLQIVTYVITSISKSLVILMTFSVVMTFVGYYWLLDIALPFFIGKALTFYIYYAVGHIWGKIFVECIERNNHQWRMLFVCLIPFVIAVLAEWTFSGIVGLQIVCQYIQFLVLPFILICLFKGISSISLLMNLFLFFGSNSLIIFGLHDMYLSMVRMSLQRFCNVEDSLAGVMMVVLTLLLCWPTIIALQRWIPQLVGKKPVLNITRSAKVLI